MHWRWRMKVVNPKIRFMFLLKTAPIWKDDVLSVKFYKPHERNTKPCLSMRRWDHMKFRGRKRGKIRTNVDEQLYVCNMLTINFWERKRGEKTATLNISNISSLISTITWVINQGNQWISNPLIISVIIKHLNGLIKMKKKQKTKREKQREGKTWKNRQAIVHL